MEQGQFCFITDDYFFIYDKERKLMRNKEMIGGKEHGRPCFYAFPDKKNPLILWCIPISSQIPLLAMTDSRISTLFCHCELSSPVIASEAKQSGRFK
jgi:hypothetical protein